MSIRTRRGFTLIELLVVISIISLLISILLPSLAKARAAARGISCLSTIRGLGFMLQMYADSQKEWLPPTALNYPGDLAAGKWIQWPHRLTAAGLLQPLSSSVSTTLASYGSRQPRVCAELGAALIGDSSNITAQSWSQYAMSMDYTGSYSHPNWASGFDTAGPTRQADLQKPAHSMALADAVYFTDTRQVFGGHQSLPGGNEVSFREKRFVLGMNGIGNNPLYNGVITEGHRHNRDQVNFAFFDGHAEARRYQGITERYGGFGKLLHTNGKRYRPTGTNYWDQ